MKTDGILGAPELLREFAVPSTAGYLGGYIAEYIESCTLGYREYRWKEYFRAA